MIIYKCDLCDQTRECAQKKIDGKYYDICQECWTPLEAKLKGKEASSARSVLLELENVLELRPLKQFFEQLKRRQKSV
jgi:hypothetical protein